MKLLITGGMGFLGSNLAERAIRDRVDLTLYDNFSRAGTRKNLSWLESLGKFRWIEGDIRDSKAVDSLIRELRPDSIFHLAGQVAMTTSLQNPRLDFEINAGGTLNLLEAVRAHSPHSTVLFSSTNKVYGDLEEYRYNEEKLRFTCVDHPNGFDESTPLSFQSPYGCSKGAADQYILDYARIFGIRAAVFRHSSIFGFRQFGTFDQGWVSWFVQKALEAKSSTAAEPFTISGTGKQVHDVLFVSDLVDLYYRAAANLREDSTSMTSIRGQAFNIGGGMSNSLSLLELFGELERIVDTRLQFTRLPQRLGDQRVFVAEISKVRKFLNWTPTTDVKTGLSQMVSWVKNHE